MSLIQNGSIDDEAAAHAQFDFRTWWARDNQLAPVASQSGGAWNVWLALAGRGFGKTRMGVEWVREKEAEFAARGSVGPIAIVGRTAADVRDVLVTGPAGILACSPPWNRPIYEPAKRRITWKSGVYATCYSAEAPDQLRGPQHEAALCDEFAAWSYIEDAWSNLIFGLRLGENPQAAVLTTPRPVKLLRELLRDPDAAITRGRTLDNAANLAASALQYMLKRYEGTRLGQQELEGKLLDDLPGALWTQAMLTECVIAPDEFFTPDMFERVVVALDPSGSDGADADDGDAQGIVVAGKLKGREIAVVLEDATGQRRPEEWAKEAWRAFDDWKADTIVCESNYGGAMVRATLQAHRPSGPVKLRSTSRGKHVRAEPISMLYEQKRVKHNRGLSRLEDELAQFTGSGYKGGASPNRADAAIWAIDELFGPTAPEPFIL